jgi:hypothetical protein
MDTTMPSPRPRSNQRRVRRSSSGIKRPPAQQRTKGDSQRALLLGAFGFATLAAALDWLVCAYTLGEFRRCGHLHIDLMLTGVAVSLTIGAIFVFRMWWTAHRAARASNAVSGTKPRV